MLGGVVSVQFGGALAATLVPEIGAGGSVLLRIGIAAVILVAVTRPRLRGHDRRAWLTVVAFGVALGLMNWSFYGSLAHLPLGVAVTVEFLGPLVLTTVLSRRLLDFVAVLAAARGVLLISEALTVPARRAQLDRAAARGDGGGLLGGVHPAERRARARRSRSSTASRSRWSSRPWWCCPPG